MTAKTIVHISCDFPDTMVPEKTRSVRNLIDGVSGFRHVVYSLNRVNALFDIEKVVFAEDRIAVAYGAPPNGILLDTTLAKVADWLHDDIVARGVSVSAIHAHKFTVEGLIAIRLAHALGVPFVANIWGDTDLRIVGVRRDLRAKWTTIAHEASALIVCAPWTIDKFDELVPLDRSKTMVLPPIIFHENFRPSAPAGNNRFVTVFNLDAYRRKNFAGLVDAIMTVARTRPDIRLDVFGSGSPKTILAIAKLIREAGATQHVLLQGKISNESFSATLNQYVAFLMPTRRETFGMVFVEAIFAGLPVLHSRGWGIDGSFGSAAIGYACDPTDQSDIVRGIETLIADEAVLKGNIVRLEAAGGLDPFKRATIVADYEALLTRITTAPAAAEPRAQLAHAV
jgi:glycosyltransferase involved in cell wall biosynthesis